MKKSIFLMIIVIFTLFNCVSTPGGNFYSKVLKQTDDTAIVQGLGNSQAEATINAEKRADTIFESWVEYQEKEINKSDDGLVVVVLYIERK